MSHECDTPASSTALVLIQDSPLQATAVGDGRSQPPNGFTRLPPELRCMVYGFMEEPRVVELEWCRKTKSWCCPTKSAHKPSILLSIWKESRQYYLNHCIPLGSDSPNHTLMLSQSDGSIKFPTSYFDPTIDTLFLTRRSGANYPNFYADISPIQGTTRIAIDACLHSSLVYSLQHRYRSAEYESFHSMVHGLPNLKEFSVISNIIDIPISWSQKKGIIRLSRVGKNRLSEERVAERLVFLMKNSFPHRDFEINVYYLRRGVYHFKWWL